MSTKLTRLQPGEGRLKVQWQRRGVRGYQLQYSLREDFSEAKSVTIKGRKKSAKTLKKLKSGQLYFVRVRTWTKSGGKRYYSSWSEPMSGRIL